MVFIEIYDNSGSAQRRWALARKLSLFCHYINTRSDRGRIFQNGGVWGKKYGNYNGSAGFVVVIDKQYVEDGASFFGEEKYGDVDIRATCDAFIPFLSKYSEYRQFNRWNWTNLDIPCVVGPLSGNVRPGRPIIKDEWSDDFVVVGPVVPQQNKVVINQTILDGRNTMIRPNAPILGNGSQIGGTYRQTVVPSNLSGYL
jgi:hypothetical protein